MNESILNKLSEVSERFNEIEVLLSQPNVTQDQKQIESWYIYYPEGVKEINGFKAPQKTLLVSGDSSIEFILKKFDLI